MKTANRNHHLFDEAAGYYDPETFSYLIPNLIETVICGLGSLKDGDPISSTELNAFVTTLTLAKKLIPDEFAFSRMFKEE